MDGTLPIINDWNFDVETYDLKVRKLFGDEIVVPPNMAQAVVRTDTNQILGVHTDKYKIIKHDDVVNSVMDSIQSANLSHDYTVDVQVLDDGRKLKGEILFNDITIQPQKDDYIKFRVPFYNSYDGSWSFSVTCDGIRLWCLNGCTTPDTITKSVSKHTASANVTSSTTKIQRGFEMFLQSEDKYRNYTNIDISNTLASNVFRKLSKLPTVDANNRNKFNEKQMDKLRTQWRYEKAELGSNAWALYNTLTHWATHTSEYKQPATTTRNRENQLAKLFKNDEWYYA
jgi:hypothetical protein